MIRPAKYTDFKAIKEIFSLVFAQEYKQKGFDVLDEVDKWQKLYPVIKVLAAFQNTYKHLLDIHVFEDEDKKIIGLIQTSSRSRDQSRWHIENLVVLPDKRGKGVAKDLLEYIFEKYMNKNVNRFTIDVDTKNISAIKLFELLGFRKYTTIHYFNVSTKKINKLKKENITIPEGFRPFKSSDAKGLFDLYVSSTPSSIRIVEQKELEDFQISSIQQVSQYFKEYTKKSNHIHCVVEKDSHIIASLEIIEKDKDLPNIIRLLVHPGYEDLNEQLLEYAFKKISEFQSVTSVLAASDHQKNKIATFKKMKLPEIFSDFMMIKDNFQIVNFKEKPSELKLELSGLKPFFNKMQTNDKDDVFMNENFEKSISIK